MRRHLPVVLICLSVGFSLLMGTPSAFCAPRAGNVVVNGVRLQPREILALEQMFHTRIPSGSYWYDNVSGLWGHEGGPTAGQMPAGLNLGGPLHANASGGLSNVFINGRSLHLLEIRFLQQCTQVTPGYYWLSPQGLVGRIGGPPLANLVVLCQRAGAGAGGGSTWRSKNTDIGVSSQGNFVGVIGRGWSVMTGP